MTDFANILFAGPCNRRCPYCIGQRLPAQLNQDNLAQFPPRGLGAFIAEVRRRQIRQVVFTGTVSDPQLYRHEARLLGHLRAQLPGASFSVHTNGALALEKLETFNLYDRACISFPSFDPETYAAHMGTRRVPDLAAIVRAAKIPVKISCVLDERNAPQVPAFLARCREIGVRRVVLRRQYGDPRAWDLFPGVAPARRYRNNPVYALDGLEVTYWEFEDAQSTSINLFADGTLGTEYLLAKTQLPQAPASAAPPPAPEQGLEREHPQGRAGR